MAMAVARQIGDAGSNSPPGIQMVDVAAPNLKLCHVSSAGAEQDCGNLFAARAEDATNAEDLASFEIKVERFDRRTADRSSAQRWLSR